MPITPCDPCDCISPNIGNDKFKQDVEILLCDTLTALGYTFTPGTCDPCACISGNIPNDKFKQDVEILLCALIEAVGAGGAGITSLTGDVTGTGPGATATTIADDAVTYAKMQNVAASRLLGRATASVGNTEEITLGTGLSFTGTTLNATAVNKFLVQWRCDENQPPAANYATFDTRNSIPVLNFDTTTQETAVFGAVMPSNYSGGNIIVYTVWAAATATAGTIGWDVTFETIAAGGQDIDSDGWATAQTITAATVSGTSGVTSVTSVTCTAGATGTDSVAALDKFRLRVRRDVANDTAAGDAQLLDVYLIEV